jgi:hypothetical protein
MKKWGIKRMETPSPAGMMMSMAKMGIFYPCQQTDRRLGFLPSPHICATGRRFIGFCNEMKCS